MLSPRPDGLSSSEEAEALWKIEDVLTPTFGNGADAKFVGRITNAGRREFYYYLPRPPHGELIAKATSSFPQYRFDWGAKEDPDWDQYHSVLHPSQEDFEKMKNSKVLDVLENHGDRLDKPREIRHWIYFDAESDRDNFIQEVVEVGFAVSYKSEDPKQDLPLGVCLTRKDHPDALNDIAVELLRFAQANNGEYDGWESEVIAPLN
jgi:hypothetical protein